MTDIDFDTVIDRRGTASLKWDRYQGRDVIPLWVADMDFCSPQPVIDALHRRVDHGVFGYGVPPRESAEIVLSHLYEHYQWQIDPQWIVWLPGLVTGLNVACRAVGDDGDDVMTAIPVYPPFMSAPQHSRRGVVKVPLVKVDEQWCFDFDLFEQSITQKTKLFLLCSPHNPVGRVFCREELERVAAICDRHNIIVCSDEIHCDLVLDQDKSHIPTAVLDKEVADRTITLMAPSKTYNIPGLGCSFAVISNPQLRHRFRRAMAGIVPDVNIMGYVAAIAAYRDGGPWLRAAINYLRGNRDLVDIAVDRMPGLSTTHVEATYLTWIDAHGLNLDDPIDFFETAGVGLSNGRDYDGAGFLRLNFACSRPLLKEALRRMARALETL